MVADLYLRKLGGTQYINVQMSLDEAKQLMEKLPPDSLERACLARAYERAFSADE